MGRAINGFAVFVYLFPEEDLGFWRTEVVAVVVSSERSRSATAWDPLLLVIPSVSGTMGTLAPFHRFNGCKAADGRRTNSMSLYEVAAATSVLLGFAPPSSLPSDSSYKLNEVLSSNPFDRPHAVMILEVRGVKGPLLSTDYLNTKRVLSSEVGLLVQVKLKLDFQMRIKFLLLL
ncbi:hypothetical protein COCNU_09G000480 [Cocos nucifera]|uniref:DUF7794 domain-containing protein n=1 Tax=Cocos nucifera TaxID=13894 RepID=A0A8K0N6T1_COCNU|nr:hypothetical protein COCNU_09G000480 [Cocos nucifera]